MKMEGKGSSFQLKKTPLRGTPIQRMGWTWNAKTKTWKPDEWGYAGTPPKDWGWGKYSGEHKDDGVEEGAEEEEEINYTTGNPKATRYGELNDILKGSAINTFASTLISSYYPSGAGKGHNKHGSSKDAQYSKKSQLTNFMNTVEAGSKVKVATAIYRDFGFYPG
ncbi:MAG: hypothetical protein AB8B69_23780, partial [Chitinophagales bacterium]